MTKEMLLAAVVREQEELKDLNKDWELQIDFDMTALLSTIGALQLAMRHPKFKDRPTHAVICHVIDAMISGIPADMPATRELARLGDNPKFDL